MRKSFHMTPDEFRVAGHAAIEWVAGYLEDVENYPVLSQVQPGDIRARLPTHPPESGESFEAMLNDLDSIIMPGITHWQSPNFFAYFNGNASAPSILGELISAGLGTQGMLWATSPAATELETHVMDWLVELLGLPDAFLSTGLGGGVIQDTASSSTLVAILAARERATGFTTNATGDLGHLTAYTSTQAHSSVEKAVRIAGIGSANLHLVDVDADYAMEPEHLERLLLEDVAAGKTPAVVIATVGTTSSTAIDPVRRIGEIARRHGAWFHVDAALAGSATVLPEMRWLHEGVELADSYVVNPHKWLFTNLDFSALYVADRSALINTLSVLPEYLRNAATESGAVIDYRDWQIGLGRRFRALKLWFVVRHYGVEGLRHHVAGHLRMAKEVADRVREHPDFDLAAPVPVNLVCFRHRGGDAVNQHILDTVNASGEAFFTHTKLDGQLTLRMAIGQTYTEDRHVHHAWDLIVQAAASAG
ncbi:MAG: aminotransferase class V-fold PLP-dependent enzyme [Acidimicrobiia bacterium]|nr:aminotransferase class V-fold PLP-dependent enzyme [Acidimicrobiia bacterium]